MVKLKIISLKRSLFLLYLISFFINHMAKKKEKKEIKEHWISSQLAMHFLYNWLIAIAINGSCVYFQNHILFKVVIIIAGVSSFVLFIFFCWFKVRLLMKEMQTSTGFFLLLCVLLSLVVINYSLNEEDKKEVKAIFKKTEKSQNKKRFWE